MVGALDSESGSPGLSPGGKHCFAFLAGHFTLTVSLSTQMYK